MKKIVLAVGTRPEVIKMAPVFRALVLHPGFSPLVISTGQHRELVHTIANDLDLPLTTDLALMTAGQTPNDVASRVLDAMARELSAHSPRVVLVQGDTTSAMATALCAFHLGIPVGHIEAGLRTYDPASPFPEEINRQIIARLARWSFAPTAGAAENLGREGVSPDSITVTGNTAIDSLLWVLGKATPVPKEPLLLVTLHRRESFGAPLRDILRGIGSFLEREPEAQVLWPLHPNPEVKAATVMLDGFAPRVSIVEPLPYSRLCRALASCRAVITDSGGIQEEGPSLGKRVLVAREVTERPEAVETGQNWLVGRNAETIVRRLIEAWHEPPYNGPLPAPNPYGDGHAAERIVERLGLDLGGATAQ